MLTDFVPLENLRRNNGRAELKQNLSSFGTYGCMGGRIAVGNTDLIFLIGSKNKYVAENFHIKVM